MRKCGNNIKLLDCTLRDGGQGLEAAYVNQVSKVYFDETVKANILKYLVSSDIEIIELGCIEPCSQDKSIFANYKDIETISKYIPKVRRKNQMYVALYIGPDTPIERIPDWNPELVDGVRVILRYSELKKSLDFCEELVRKGYKIFVQPMLTMRYTDDELHMLIKRTNEMDAFALYFVDSYGYMEREDVIRFFDLYNSMLKNTIKIGFHAHNNLNMAYSNVKEFINYAGDREIIIDSCVLGMGQGAGNLQTEIIVPYLNKCSGKEYVYKSVLEACELVEAMTPVAQWGYSVAWALPAVYKAAYKYAMIMRMKKGFSYPMIDEILSKMPENYKQRFTEENLDILLKNFEK